MDHIIEQPTSNLHITDVGHIKCPVCDESHTKTCGYMADLEEDHIRVPLICVNGHEFMFKIKFGEQTRLETIFDGEKPLNTAEVVFEQYNCS